MPEWTVQNLAYLLFVFAIPGATIWATFVQKSLGQIRDNTAAQNTEIAVLKTQVGHIKTQVDKLAR